MNARLRTRLFKVGQLLLNQIWLVLLLGITIFLCFQNYTPGTWLTGWDTLHPEFDFPLNLKRVIQGVWREEQGLGAVAAHAHMADLPRILLLGLGHFFWDKNFLRWAYIFLCLILGPWGVYWFLSKTLPVNTTSQESFLPAIAALRRWQAGGHLRGGYRSHSSEVGVKVAAFLGGLFYLLNLGTLQHFYVPFEMFPTQFAVLGWVFGLATKFLDPSSRKKQGRLLFWFALANFFGAGMAYAPQLWYAYFICLASYLFLLAFFGKKKVASFKKAGLLLGLVLLTNCFWLLPNVYFLKNHSADVPLAKTNRMFSEEAYLTNKYFGNFADAAILKNFLFDWSQRPSGKNNFGYLLASWREHLQRPKIASLGYLGFGLMVSGVVVSLLRKKPRAGAMLPVLVICFVVLISMNPPFESFFGYFRERVSLIREGLRLPFTKFSILLSFAYAFYFGLFWQWLLGKLLRGALGMKVLGGGLVLVMIGSLGLYMAPAFIGDFINPSLHLKIPEDYFEAFSWFDQQPEYGRVMHFPLHTVYGWLYHDWGYQGAGFAWFGIKQPFLDRDFDRWNPPNEQNYREVSQAVYSQDLSLLETLLEKYQIKWIFLDLSVVIPGEHADREVLFYDQIRELFDQSDKINLVGSFGSKIRVYEYQSGEETMAIRQASLVPQVGPSYRWGFWDQAFLENGNYYTSVNGDGEGVFYPFRTFLSKKETLEPETFDWDEEKIHFRFRFPSFSGQLVWPNLGRVEDSVPSQVYLQMTEGVLRLRFALNLPEIEGYFMPIKEKVVTFPKAPGGQILGINRDLVWPIDDQIKEEVYLGEVFLKIGKQNQIYLWEGEVSREVPVDLATISAAPEACSRVEEGTFFGIAQRGTNNLEIISEGTPVCLHVNVGSLLGEGESYQNDLLKVSYRLGERQREKASFSFFDQHLNQIYQPENNLLLTKDPETLFLRFRLEADEEKSQVKVEFSDLNLGFLKPVSTSDFELGEKEFVYPSQPFSEDEIVVRKPLPEFDLGAIDLTLPSHQVHHCGNLVPFQAERKLVGEDDQFFVQYLSQKGSACDWHDLPGLAHDQGYLLMIDSQNVSGLPLRLCLVDYRTRRCQLFLNLGKNENFQKEFFVLPPVGKEGRGFDLH
ncbi:hypothetical protein ACFLZP_03305, partial [Patescibacteria group bacterium]